MNETIRIRSGGVQMIAHRGLSGLWPENTEAAFCAAGQRSYDGIETDVHRTADGEFVVIHDDTTGRVAGQDLSVEGSTLAQLRGLSLLDGNGVPQETLRIPLLRDYLRICRESGKLAVLELKNRFSAQDIERILQICEEEYRLSRMIFISFSLENLLDLRRLRPQAEIQYLVEAWKPELARTLQEQRMGLDADHRGLTRDIVREIKEAGLVLNTWTVNDPAAAAALIEWGVDQITTNILE